MKIATKDLTIEEKIKLLCGIDFWRLHTLGGKLPEVYLSDGPCGLRRVEIDGTKDTGVAMPTPSVLANTWNKELAELTGKTIADECVERGTDVLLAPGVNIKRSPLCGRNFEYMSEDPYVAGVMAAAYIDGVQKKGVGTCLKHFCLNNSDYDRHYQSAEVDERTMREIYLPAFEIAISRSQPWSVMCAYNPVNGVYAAENKYILTDILRKELGFRGIVISDWRAVKHAARSVKAGLDLEMPFRAEAYGEVKAAYDCGWVSEEEIDVLVERLLDFIYKNAEAAPARRVEYTKEQRHENAAAVAREGIVLLKNEDGILPLRGGKILVGGLGADSAPIGGGGSSLVITEYKQEHLGDLIARRLGDAAEVTKSKLILRYSDKMVAGSYIVSEAYEADTVVYCIGNDHTIELESRDRRNINLPGTAEDMLIELIKRNKNVIVVVESGSAVDMSAWKDDVKAIVYAGFAGEGANEAIADILTGAVCPSGKLTETFPNSLDDTPTGRGTRNTFVTRYNEGLMVGYRYYDTLGKEVAFPFGHGLSYASFEYSDLGIEKEGETDYTLSFTVTNTSDVDAKEVSQIYVKDVFASAVRPEKELREFVKTELRAGESKRVKLKLDSRAFAYYNTSLHSWYVENGIYEILVGASSRDIRLKGRIDIHLPECEQFSFRSVETGL
ncbi:MAG: glycoside hydrolase family 3 C-terminal domain-containing protein [Clostridia bacterium]|nr:glycoside hydrolase family 3 C-terminal domain-containing protein [Clostridia bacterium]